MSILGNRVLRTEDPKFLTTGGTYVDDVELPGDPLHVTYVRSPIAHGRITELDVEAARSAPGVVDVVTAADMDIAPIPPPMVFINQEMARSPLADEVVRFVGEPVAAILTEERYQGEDAAELVVVDYEPLPTVIDAESAADEERSPLFPDAESPLAMEVPAGDQVADLDDCEVVVSQRIVNQRLAPCPIEPRAAAAYWTDDGRLHHYSSCQGAHAIRDQVAEALGLETDQVRTVTPDVGGGFGAKTWAPPEEVILGWLSKRVGRPVRMSETRSENMVAMTHGRAQTQDVTIGGSRDGTIGAYRLEVVADAGAYPSIGALLPFMTRTMLTGVYDITNAEFSSRAVPTNTTPVGAYRGAGRPEAAAAIERAVDLFAAEIGMDPAEVRRRNLIPADAFPHTTVGGATYDTGDYERALDLALEAAGYAELRADQKARRERGDRVALGIGVAIYVEITAFDAGGEHAHVELRPDGTILAITGSSPYGQGHHTAWAQVISNRLGVPIEDIEVVHGDTDIVPAGGVTGGSRSVQIAGASMHDAAGKLADQAREHAANLLEAATDDVELDPTGGVFHVAGTPAVTVGWAEVARAAADPLIGLSDFEAEGATFPFGAHIAVVEVDTETGQVTLERMVAVDDAGRILNPLLAEGQVHGGIAQGAAQALLEEVRYDEDGNPLTANFADYGVISATELPMFERIPMETPTPMNPLGAKGIGESGTIGATPAVQNAAIDAVSHLGVRHIEMPLTPERVWNAIQAASAG